MGADLGKITEVMGEIGCESESIADIIENVFHLNKLAMEHIGKKWVGVRKEQTLSSLEKVVDNRRKMAEWALTRVMGDSSANEKARKEVVKAYRSSKRAWTVLQESKRREREWQECRKLEKAGPEKFWQEIKRLKRPLSSTGPPSLVLGA